MRTRMLRKVSRGFSPCPRPFSDLKVTEHVAESPTSPKLTEQASLYVHVSYLFPLTQLAY